MAVGDSKMPSATGSATASYDVTSLPPPTPPIHVHVDTSTPVHVHIRKTKKDKGGEDEMDQSGRTASSGRGPWIPPPGKTSKGTWSKSSQKGPKYVLPPQEPYQPDPEFGKEMNDLIQDYINKCTQIEPDQCTRIKLPGTPRKAHQCDRLISGGQDQGNEFLQRSLHVLQRNQGSEKCSRHCRTPAGQDQRLTYERLVQIEKELEDVFRHFSEIQAGMRDFQESHDPEEAARKKEALCHKISQMDHTYKNLRRSLGLPDAISEEMSQRLESTEKRNEELNCVLRDHENELDRMERQVQCEKDYNLSLRRMQTELEETRCCLQKELLNKTAEIERTTIQMKNLQGQMGEHLQEVEHLQSYVDQTSRRNECEKEALKKALKVQLERATRCDESMQKANAKIAFMDEESEKLKLLTKQMENELEHLRPEAESKAELEKVCQRLKDDLKQLQPLPELLASTEQRLKEEQAKNASNETRVTEQARLIAEISSKIDGNNENVRKLTESVNCLRAENTDLLAKLNNANCLHNQDQSTLSELNNALQMKNELINQLNCKLEDKDCNNMSINRQLEEALAESNRLTRMVEDRALQLTKLIEKQNQCRLKEIEAQLACSKQEIKQLKLEKQDLECKYGRQMQDLREKLEQCDMATHNMQSYVSYLKTAYASVFNDPNLTAQCPSMPTKDSSSS